MKQDRVLVVYSGWLGDLVWIIPTIHALRTVFDSVSLVVSQVQAPLADVMKNGLVNDVYVDRSAQRLASARAVRQDVHAKGTKTFIDLKGRGKTGIYMPWGLNLDVWIPHRRDAREYALSRLLHPGAATMPARDDGHMVDAYLSGLEVFGVRHVPVSFDLPFRDQTIEEGERIAKREGLRTQKSVVLNIGSAQHSKIWPAENYVRLAEVLVREMACKVVLMGARDFTPNDNYDLQMARALFSRDDVTNLVEETDLAVDSYLLNSGAFSVSVGNDSFAGHMAGSANEMDAHTPGAIQADSGRWYRANHTVSLFAPTNPVFCRPYDPTGAFNTVIVPESYPSDCGYDRKGHTCPHYGDRYCVERAHCMRHLSVEQVVAAVEEKLRAQTHANND